MIDFDTFLGWAESRFDSVIVSGKEIKLNSIFVNDHKHHLWACPDKGVFHCWKSDQKGGLVRLVMDVDGCSYAEAAERIGAQQGDRMVSLEARLQEAFDKVETKPKGKMVLPPNTYKITSLSKENAYRIQAENYIKGRKLPLGDLMVCISGDYRDRIVIPYYSSKGELIYWNSRDLTNKAYLRYRGPKKDEVGGIGKEDVLWFEEWPRPKTKVYLTEGEFDAMSLNVACLAAAACGGKAVSEKQIEMLKPYQVAIAFDADKSGAGALNKLGEVFEHHADFQVAYVRPPLAYKDWNCMLIDCGPKVIRAYIEKEEKVFKGLWDATKLRLNAS